MRIKEQFLTSIKVACQKIGWTFYISVDSFAGIEGMILGNRKFVEAVRQIITGEDETPLPSRQGLEVVGKE